MADSTDLLELLPAAVYTTDAQGLITFYNQAAAELWGHRPEIGTAQWCGSWRLYWPDGRPMAHDECPIAVTFGVREARCHCHGVR
jgi:PAS domain-containing protein